MRKLVLSLVMATLLLTPFVSKADSVTELRTKLTEQLLICKGGSENIPTRLPTVDKDNNPFYSFIFSCTNQTLTNILATLTTLSQNRYYSLTNNIDGTSTNFLYHGNSRSVTCDSVTNECSIYLYSKPENHNKEIGDIALKYYPDPQIEGSTPAFLNEDGKGGWNSSNSSTGSHKGMF